MNSRQKGARGERELAELLRDAGYGDAQRGQQRSGLEQADVVGGPPGLHLECKRVQNLNIWKAHEQATRDAPPGEVPVVACRRDRGPWLAVLPLADLLRLCQDRSMLDALLGDPGPSLGA